MNDSIFTEEELLTLRRTIERTYGTIAEDLFVNEDGEFDPSITLENGDILEICLDADRWVYYYPESASKEEVQELIKRLYKQDVKVFNREVDNILPTKTYVY